MRIEMLTLAAGPEGVLEVGRVYEVAKGLGQGLLDGGFAIVPTDPNAEPTPTPAAPLPAADEPQQRGRKQADLTGSAPADAGAGSSQPAKPKASSAKRSSSRRGTRS